jgi:hypothetical protein
MKPDLAALKTAERNPNANCRNLDGKTVEFFYDLGGKLMLLIGQFAVDFTPNLKAVEIRYTGRLHPQHPPGSEYLFHLSPSHLRSTVPAAKVGSQVDFFIEKPLLKPDCVQIKWREQEVTESVQ